MNKLCKSVVFVAAMTLSMTALPVQAATPTDTSIAKLIEVTQMDKMMQDMLNPNGGMVESIATAMLADKDFGEINEKQHRQLGKIVVKYVEKTVELSRDEMLKKSQDSFKEMAKKYYTQEEVDAQIDFYGSDVGKSILSKQPKLMQAYMTKTMPSIFKIMEKHMLALKPQMQAEIEALQLND